MNWSNLSPENRALAILSIVQSTAGILKGIADIVSLIQKIRDLDPSTLPGKLVYIELSQRIGKQGPMAVVQTENEEGDVVQAEAVMDDETLEKVSPELGTVDQAIGAVVSDVESASKLDKVFSLGTKVCATLSVVVNIATCVCIGYQIKADFDQNQPAGIKALVSIPMAATSILLTVPL